MAFSTALVLGLAVGPWVIRRLGKMQFLDTCDKSPCEALRENKKKKSTPTMGGVLILFSFLLSSLLWSNLGNGYVLGAIFSALGFAFLGFADDYAKAFSSKNGLRARVKLFWLIGLSILVAIVLAFLFGKDKNLLSLTVPFSQAWKLDLSCALGLPFIAWATLVLVGSTNAVNLTDGLDGLAIGCSITSTTALLVLAYLVGREDLATSWHLPFLPQTKEIAIPCLAMLGASLAYLWFNAFPASVFMGDCGSLMLGGFLGYVALALRQEIFLAIVGGVFVLETLSVAIQVISFKTRGKRVFRCAPIHHHFVFSGIEEPKVALRFWLVSLLFALLAFLTLRLR